MDLSAFPDDTYDITLLLGPTTGNTALSASVKSPTFACVRKISRNKVTITALEDFIARPVNRAQPAKGCLPSSSPVHTWSAPQSFQDIAESLLPTAPASPK